MTIFIGSLAAGIYNPALTLINTTFLVPHVVWQVLLPMIARQQYHTRLLRWVVGLTSVGNLVYGGFWALVFWYAADWLVLHVYDEQYLAAAPLLQIMFLIPLFKSFNFCWTTLMVAHDAQVRRTTLQAIGAVFSIAANLMFLPVYGLLAAAWVNVAAEIILFVCYGYGAWYTLRPRSAH
ncbi:MAG: hypothetical protein HC837_19350 [Chloroflexaceae bacterium]|nr:hypothetical protein [Chloroflexaceae bacterium]